ncbi:hypothetical protein PsorP6_009450 [Peronosclerospora sorghi]|uniref:Uncharacterized protein n=1 Tax=Peronosclerospora sorghi TaxID=230839 RepID=A0ACC0W185_9STRA|nr:hypothetical protein PsorP6_009450 [Peronosclerospora sorghi]
MDTPRRPRGRPPSRSWAFFTTIVEPQKQSSAICRHCNQLVHYHQKWGQARTHLMKCSQFLRLMDTIPANEVPDWYLAEITRRQHVLNRNKSASICNVPGFQNEALTQPTSPFNTIQPTSIVTAPMMTFSKENRDELAGNTTNPLDVDQLEENVAMHLFTTISMEKLVNGKVEFPFLFQTLQACIPHGTLFRSESLMTKMLTRCFDSVKGRVDKFFKTGSVPITLSVDRTTPGSVCYMANLASSQNYPLYLESVKVENNSLDGEWGATDVARVMDTLSCPVAGCVLPCSSPDLQQTRKLLEERFPAMYFHGCMRDALWSIIRQIFTASETTEKKCNKLVPLAQEIQEFAVQCKDLVFFLPPQQRKVVPWKGTNCGSTMLHVTVTRRLTIEEAFDAILLAETFLDADDVLDELLSARHHGHRYDGSNHGATTSHLQTQLVQMVRCPEFVEKLRKFLEVLRPVHSLLVSVDHENEKETSLLLSEVYSSFSRLVQQYASSRVLQEDEKKAVQALVHQEQEIMLGSAHVLAYLLDPVLLGEDLPADMKVQVEQKMVSTDCTSRLPSDQEVLYAQYLEFQQFAITQKVHKAETLAFRDLPEDKQSPLQFWFTDGARWPLLQAFACRIFVMPVCAASAPRVVSEAGVALRHLDEKIYDFVMSEKLAFVRVNTHQLDLAEADESARVNVPQKFQLDNLPHDITASILV